MIFGSCILTFVALFSPLLVLLVSAQDDACMICPEGSTLEDRDKDLLVADGTCGLLQDGIEFLAPEECQSYLDNLALIDVAAWCGCTGVPAPNLCDSLCGEGGTIIPGNEDLEASVPGLGLTLTCAEAALATPYITQLFACTALGSFFAEQCCEQEGGSPTVPTPAAQPSAPTVPSPTIDTVPVPPSSSPPPASTSSSSGCTVCPEGSTMEMPDTVLSIFGGTCSELEAGMQLDATICEMFQSSVAVFVDVAKWCGCSGTETTESICSVCVADGGDIINEQEEISIAEISLTLSCEQAEEAAVYIRTEELCGQFIDVIDPVCCASGGGGGGTVVVPTVAPTSSPTFSPTRAPTMPPTAATSPPPTSGGTTSVALGGWMMSIRIASYVLGALVLVPNL